MIDLTISIVTANNKKLILDCLRSIYETVQGLMFEIYVVINASTDESEEAICKDFPKVKLIINQEKKGFTHNHNAVIQRSKGKYVLILNDDTLILNDALKKMVEFMEGSPDVGILGCKILNPDGSLQWSCGRRISHRFEYWNAGMLKALLPFLQHRHFRNTQEVSWVTGACLLVRNKAIRVVGGLDENIIIYFEDVDWCYRMIKAGWKVIFFPHAEIIHYFGQTRKQWLARDMFIIYQSRLYFFSKHYSRFILYLVRILTILELLLRYIRSLTLPRHPEGRGGEGKEVRIAYKQAIKLALAPSNLHNGVKT